MSGYAADIISYKGIDTEGVELLTKPFSPLVLLAKVREVLDRPGTRLSIPIAAINVFNIKLGKSGVL